MVSDKPQDAYSLQKEVSSLRETVDRLKKELSGQSGGKAVGASQYTGEPQSPGYDHTKQPKAQDNYQLQLANAFERMYAMGARMYENMAKAAKEVKSLYELMGGQPAYAGMAQGYQKNARYQDAGKNKQVSYNGR
jgi:hypothetical protein